MTRSSAASGGLVAAAACVAVALVYLAAFAVPPLIPTFVEEVGLTYAEAGALMSAFTLAFAATSVLAGMLADRVGAARVVAAGLLLGAAASVATSLSESLAVLLPVRAAVGVAVALVWAPGVSLVLSHLARERAARGTSWFVSGLYVGVALAFLVTPFLEDALDWRWVFRAYGVACLAGVPPLLLARSSRSSAAATGREIASVVRDARLLAVCACVFVALGVIYGVYTWIPPYLDEAGGFETARVGLASMLLALAAIPASLAGGAISDRTGRPLVVGGAGLAAAACVGLLAAVPAVSYWGVVTVAVLAAVAISFAFPALLGLAGRAVAPSLAGTATGLANSVGMLGAIVATFGGGVVVGASGYDLVFVLVAAAALAGGVAVVPAAARVVRRAPPP